MSNYRYQGVFEWIHSLHIRAHLLRNSQEMGCAVQLERLRTFFVVVASQKKCCGAPHFMKPCVD